MITSTPTPTQVGTLTARDFAPLTTPWSYSPSCTNEWYYIPEKSWIMQDSQLPDFRSCQPPQVTWDSIDNIVASPGVGTLVNR